MNKSTVQFLSYDDLVFQNLNIFLFSDLNLYSWFREFMTFPVLTMIFEIEKNKNKITELATLVMSFIIILLENASHPMWHEMSFSVEVIRIKMLDWMASCEYSMSFPIEIPFQIVECITKEFQTSQILVVREYVKQFHFYGFDWSAIILMKISSTDEM